MQWKECTEKGTMEKKKRGKKRKKWYLNNFFFYSGYFKQKITANYKDI